MGFDLNRRLEIICEIEVFSHFKYTAYGLVVTEFWFVRAIVFCAFLGAENEPGVSIAEVQSHQTVDCSLVFSPTQVRFWPNISQ